MMRKNLMILVCTICCAHENLFAQATSDENIRKLFRHVDYEASWSHDGSRIAFISNRNGFFNLYVADSAGKHIRQLTTKNSNEDMPAFSPSSNQIAFVSDMDGNNEIYTINSDGTNLKRITNDAADDIHPDWSTDGDKLLFNSSRNSKDISNPDRYDIMIISIATGKIEQLTEGGINTYASFSSTGAEIVYRRSMGAKSQVMTMSLSNRAIYTVTDGNSFDGWPSWGRGDREIFFSSDRSGSFQIYSIHLPTKKIERLTSMQGRFTNPRLSPDAETLMFTGRQAGNQNVEIFLKSLY